MKPFLSVVIPVYNEEKRLSLTLIDINKHLAEADFDYEILIVNDGSTDATVEIAKRFSHIIKSLRIIDNKVNRGKGAVVRQGMLEAKGRWRLLTDADNSTSIDQFQKMLPYFEEGYDVVIGSRDIKGAKLIPPQPFYRRFLGDVGNLIIQALLLPGVKDTQAGFKCFSAKSAEEVFPKARIDRWGFDVEILALAKKFGFKIKEMPIIWVNNPFSHVKPQAYFQVLFEVLKVRWWLWRNIYKI